MGRFSNLLISTPQWRHFPLLQRKDTLAATPLQEAKCNEGGGHFGGLNAITQ